VYRGDHPVMLTVGKFSYKSSLNKNGDII